VTYDDLIELKNVTKKYHGFTALDGIDLKVKSGEFTAVVGKSGSGKSTLLNLLCGIDNPSSGEVHVNGSAIHRMNQDELATWRGLNVGVIFQFFQLLPTLTVLENVMLPMDFCNTFRASERKARAVSLLEKLDIADQQHKLPANLSGGQQQRAAMARALANDPPLLLADEPTGNLDSNTSSAVLHLFQTLSASGKTIVMVTHEREIASYVDRVITLADGHITNQASV
jgi:putative ABC transport system ATP-binding protein